MTTDQIREHGDIVARLHNNGTEIRVDMGNTGENWPDCSRPQEGFPWLSFGKATWQAAEDYACKQGATVILQTGNLSDGETVGGVKRFGPAWARLLPQCDTHPEDVPGRMMTEREFVRNHANRTSQ